MGQVDPVAFEDVLHLQFKQIRIGEDVSAAAEDAGVLVVLERTVQQLFNVAETVAGGGQGHGVSLWGEVIPHDQGRGQAAAG